MLIKLSIVLPGDLCVCVIHCVPEHMWAESLKLKGTPSAVPVIHSEDDTRELWRASDIVGLQMGEESSLFSQQLTAG